MQTRVRSSSLPEEKNGRFPSFSKETVDLSSILKQLQHPENIENLENRAFLENIKVDRALSENLKALIQQQIETEVKERKRVLEDLRVVGKSNVSKSPIEKKELETKEKESPLPLQKIGGSTELEEWEERYIKLNVLNAKDKISQAMQSEEYEKWKKEEIDFFFQQHLEYFKPGSQFYEWEQQCLNKKEKPQSQVVEKQALYESVSEAEESEVSEVSEEEYFSFDENDLEFDTYTPRKRNRSSSRFEKIPELNASF